MTCWFLSSCPTSNHNNASADPRNEMLYIVLFLHQTTTTGRCIRIIPSCISYYSYIKPQHAGGWQSWLLGCISYYSYIKPQPTEVSNILQLVVYRTIPTSNHNKNDNCSSVTQLYIVLFLHQTTTPCLLCYDGNELYIVLFLHQTTTECLAYKQGSVLYIVLFLHQTTTVTRWDILKRCCISYYSYIKPQLTKYRS